MLYLLGVLMSDMTEFISYFLPSSLLQYFEIISIEEGKSLEDPSDEALFISLDEKNILPDGYSSTDYESKGFTPAKQIQDFPIRGKAVFFNIRRRIWRNKMNPQDVIQSTHVLEHKGVKLTKELAAFLKDAGYDLRRYD